jgi:predicted metal-dependent enzyme (double-stranded beta helix superfamily)
VTPDYGPAFRETVMDYALADFCADCRAVLKAQGVSTSSLRQIAGDLAKLIANPAFVAGAFSEDMPAGQHLLHHDVETDVYVLAHVQAAGKTGKPHSHGASWAIYGSARGYTDMTEWRRVNPETEDKVELEVADKYRLRQGETRAYGPNVIHSTAHPEKAWVIRVTGTDLDSISRYHFRPQRDRILEKT